MESLTSVDHREHVLVEIDDAHHHDSSGQVVIAAVRYATLAEKPVGKRHTGRGVHVIVLLSNSSSCAAEMIPWANAGNGALAELRQKVFWDVIDRGRSYSRASSGRVSSTDRFDGKGSVSGKRESKSADDRVTGVRGRTVGGGIATIMRGVGVGVKVLPRVRDGKQAG